MVFNLVNSIFSLFWLNMIAFLRGNFIQKTPNRVVVDVNGVGYDLQISVNTYAAIADKSNGLLHTYLHITENGQTLFGFADLPEKELFLQLISVSGVGAATARIMLSGMRAEEIIYAIVNENKAQLEKVKGIGKKTVERLILELKDKLLKTGFQATINPVNGISKEFDAVQALVALGIPKPNAEKAVAKVVKSADVDLSLEQIIKDSLQNL
jgi:holliday junction DNA helicase RuvA